MITEKIIPDASVILKWFLDGEIDTANAILLRDHYIQGKIQLLFSSFLYLEVGNVLCIKNKTNAKKQIHLLYDLQIPEIRLSSKVLDLASDIATKFTCSLYDASYHALALIENGMFVTSDEQYYHKTHSFGSIMLLGDFALLA